MQGGYSEQRLNKALEEVRCCQREGVDKKQHFVEPPLDTLQVENEIVISPAVDAWLEKAREHFAMGLAVPVAIVHGDPSVEVCRSRKHKRVQGGAKQVLWLQQNLYSESFAHFFYWTSFCCEEEFYLLMLPTLFWNIDYRFARHVTYIVTVGLLWGNLLKDVFRLPRPKNVEPAIRVSEKIYQIDSSACRDFGYPSTHAMNSITNSAYAVTYCVRHGIGLERFGVFGLCALALVYTVVISFGRLYLGVHSPMDIKGGISLGLVIVCMAQGLPYVDDFVLSTPHVGICLLLVFVVILVLNPQPRPMTPTFIQNCTLVGLCCGCCIGHRMETDRRYFYSLTSSEGSNDLGVVLLTLRTMLGFAILLTVRYLFKKFMGVVLRSMGLEPYPVKPLPKDEVVSSSNRQTLQGWDLVGAATAKLFLNMFLAWTITCGCPAVFDSLGIPCEMRA